MLAVLVLILAAMTLPTPMVALAAPAQDWVPQVATARDLLPIAADYTHPDALYPLEVQALGREHAREHLADRNLARRLVAEHKIVLARSTPKNVGPSDTVGHWSTAWVPAGSSSNAVGVHAILFHTGKVLLFGGYYDHEDRALETEAYLYDPVTARAHEVDPPHDMFCAGAVLLQDGTALVVGGRYSNRNPRPGSVWVMRFDPVSEKWLEEPETPLGRYYPTATELPSGRVLITSGNDLTGHRNPTIEVYTPGADGSTGTMKTVLTDHPLDLYPKQYVMPDGRVLIVEQSDTSLVNPSNWNWLPLPHLRVRRSGNPSAVLLPAAPGAPEGRVMITGGGHGRDGGSTAVSELFDDEDLDAGWQPLASMPEPRSHMNIVYLPDGKILGIGGNSDGRFAEPQYAALQYDPQTNVWTTLASQTMRRGYHSTALLLPDGRVLSAGDTGPGGGSTHLEIYSPSYLFRGARPVITDVSSSEADYGDQLRVRTNTAISRIVLVHPSATTHANDMSGRFVELQVHHNADGTTMADMPADARLAQPGYWMMFALNAADVPSVARWVHLGPYTYGG